MGNTHSDIFEFDVQAQIGVLNADAEKHSIYKYITGSNEGLLIKLAKRALKTKDYSDLDFVIKNECVDFLYNKGKGENVRIFIYFLHT